MRLEAIASENPHECRLTHSEGDAFEEITSEMERKTTSLQEILGYIPDYAQLSMLMHSAVKKLHGVETEELYICNMQDILEHHEHSIH